jgi:hypothetical protein
MSPEAAEAVREEARVWAEFQRRMEFLRAQARLPVKVLLRGTTAIMSGKVRT